MLLVWSRPRDGVIIDHGLLVIMPWVKFTWWPVFSGTLFLKLKNGCLLMAGFNSWFFDIIMLWLLLHEYLITIKKSETDKKVIQPAFRCMQYPEAGQNTQHIPSPVAKHLLYTSLPALCCLWWVARVKATIRLETIF